MDTEKCGALLCALETGSLSGAAQRLGYTPSGVSRMMAALEQECGFPLLLRGRSGVEATEECKRLLPVFQELVCLGERCRQLCGQLSGVETGSVTVGTTDHAYYRELTGVIGAFGAQFPGIRVQIVEGTSSQLSQLVEEGKADFCVISRREGRHQFIPLYREQLMAWVPKDHPAARAGELELRALEREPFILVFPGQETDNSRLFARNHITPNTRHAVHDVYGAYAMVEAGLGVTLVSQQISRAFAGRVAAVPLRPAQWLEIGVALPERGRRSPAADRFVQFALPYFQRLGERESCPDRTVPPV